MGERDPYLGGATRLKKCLERVRVDSGKDEMIYKEEVIDLLKGDENGKGVRPSHVPIQIRETTNSGILLAYVTEVEVTSQEEMMSLMLRVFVRRSTAMCPNPLMNIQEAKSKLLEAAKLHVHIGLNTYLGKINTRVPTSSYELSTLNSASNVILEGNWVSHK
ncbi:kinesin-like protein KIN-4C [Tanacetum coccineum]